MKYNTTSIARRVQPPLVRSHMIYTYIHINNKIIIMMTDMYIGDRNAYDNIHATRKTYRDRNREKGREKKEEGGWQNHADRY